MTELRSIFPNIQFGLFAKRRHPAKPGMHPQSYVRKEGRIRAILSLKKSVHRLYVYSDQSDQLFRSNPTVYRSEATMV
jgi:hypothetical protein